MRFMLQAIVLMSVLMTLPCRASYDTMPTPPPNTSSTQTQSQDEKAKVKRGAHWYRSPQRANAVEQMKLADKYRKNKQLRKAANAYQALVYAWPDSPEAPTAQLKLAQVQEERDLPNKAFDEYQYLFDYYPGHFDYREVLGRQFKIANYLMTTRKGSFLFFPGFEAPERAIPLYEKIIRNAPTWEYAATAQLNIGIIHELNDEDEEAVAAFEIVQNRYSDETILAQASFREAHCLFKIYRDRPNDENACNAARAALVQFISSYPNHAKVPKAKDNLAQLNAEQAKRAYEMARYYDQIAHRPKAALIAYEDYLAKYTSKYSADELAVKARARVEILRKEVKSHEKK
jgi:outer membrane protein assembly factor BamD (BamD/ComL family)